MRQPARLVLLTALLLAVPFSLARAQQPPQKPATGVITGRITLGDTGLPNVPVLLFSTDRMQRTRGSVARAVTDYEGNYKLTNVAAGSYTVTPNAAAFIGPSEGMFGEMGRTINIADGETVEDINFSLKRGGVITGRVVDADGNPVVAERIHLNVANKDPRQQRQFSFNANPQMYETDDRGVYRLFGLPAGRYTVSVGEAGQEGEVRFGFGKRTYYARTYHPGVTDASKAAVLEVTEGSEITNADITLGRMGQAFSASGRVVDENGKPVANARIGNGSLLKDRKMMGSMGYGALSDGQGQFRLEGLPPGRYAVFVWNEGKSESYTDPITFEITEGDVSGLELKFRRGASISGVAVIEGTADKAVFDTLSQLSIWATPAAEDRLFVPTFAPIKIAPDGSFRIIGVQPGKMRIHLANYPPPKGFMPPRIERDGVVVQEIEVTRGAEITGVRIVFQYGTGRVRGLVKVENGTLPAGSRVMVTARRLNDNAGNPPPGVRVDSRGRFALEGLPTGEYELNLHAFITGDTPRRIPVLKQKVNVMSGTEVEATFTLDLNAKQTEGGNNE